MATPYSRVLLLGAGRVGSAIARDLAGEFELTVLDASTDALARLRAHAFCHQRLLNDVACDVVARRLVFTPDMI